jgi:hypothetical protein
MRSVYVSHFAFWCSFGGHGWVLHKGVEMGFWL